ncbi:SMI1/KNR4 family protein [Saccharothrix variisporea]|uniref:Uncharacterized protein n=1 Tax=Saccharothrix variisporea TaxID=543527 RepID=A0A495X9H6_9PSEU|nr:SMI1/KNR4 family protein [Saccharothrix variisporea]RKT69795.1 hypothetical protein DFJ66_3033 [Saccharothrix variisporea]
MDFENGAALGSAVAEHLRQNLINPRVRNGVAIEPGLTDAEIAAVEDRFGFEFADDHRTFLAELLPTGGGFPDWRDGDPEALRDQVEWPVEGVLFDVVENGFWYKPWGERPDAEDDAVELARTLLAAVPRMIPVTGHRCLPGGRGTFGYPVLSMYQTDIIPYGANLLHFFGGQGPVTHTHERPIPFWDDLLDYGSELLVRNGNDD